jgi:NAD-dependent dihydropyrimidine dehydrogenase PreA subunit
MLRLVVSEMNPAVLPTLFVAKLFCACVVSANSTAFIRVLSTHCLLCTARCFSCYNIRFGSPALFRETDNPMAYVIAEPCIGTKDTACVDACPVDCIHPKKDSEKYATEEMLYIDPVECIDCGACVPVCPVSAIFALDDLPEKWAAFTERNAKYFGR